MTRVGRPISIEGPIAALADDVGGMQVLAKRLGVVTSTVRRWALGETLPGAVTREALNRMARRRGIEEPYK